MSSAQLTMPRSAKPKATTLRPASTSLVKTSSVTKTKSTKPLVETKQDVIISQKQSLDLVQILLSATISSIVYLRGVFPEDCFEMRMYNTEDPNYTYKNFKEKVVEVKDVSEIKELKKHGIIEWKILTQGRNEQVDKLLSWIDLGVGDALKKQYLKTAQLSFYEVGQVHRDKALEIYTFSFAYHSPGIPVMGVQNNSEGEGVPYIVARDDVRGTVRKLITSIQTFEDLPKKSTVCMQLTYNDSCPDLYEPPGFVVCPDPNLILREKEGVTFGTVNTAHHKSVSPSDILSITNLSRVGLRYFTNDPTHVDTTRDVTPPVDGDSRSDEQSQYLIHPKPTPDVVMPDIIAYHDNANLKTLWRKYGNIPAGQQWPSLEEYLKACHRAHSHVYAAGKHAAEADEMMVAGKIPAVAWKRKSNATYKHVHQTAPDPTPHLTLQAKKEAKKRDRRSGMAGGLPILTSQRSQGQNQMADGRSMLDRSTSTRSDVPGAQQSQEIKQAEAVRGMAISRDNDNLDTQVLPLSTPMPHGRPLPLMKMEWSQTAIQNARSNRRADSRASADDDSESDEGVKCECGSGKDENTMILCELCRKWQHIECYGYFECDSNKLPEHHVCYSCILHDDKGLLGEMSELCLYRYYLRQLYRVGEYPTGVNPLKEDLNISHKKILEMDKRLRAEGYLYLSATNPTKRQSFKDTFYSIVTTPAQMEKLLAEYFDPTRKVAQYFEIPTGDSYMTSSGMGSAPAVVPSNFGGSIYAPGGEQRKPPRSSGGHFQGHEGSSAVSSTQGTPSPQVSRLGSSVSRKPRRLSGLQSQIDEDDGMSNTQDTPGTQARRSSRKTQRVVDYSIKPLEGEFWEYTDGTDGRPSTQDRLARRVAGAYHENGEKSRGAGEEVPETPATVRRNKRKSSSGDSVQEGPAGEGTSKRVKMSLANSPFVVNAIDEAGEETPK